MLKPIVQPRCGGALNACLNLQMHLLRWLCDPAVKAVDVLQASLTPPCIPTQIEADWLWRFLWGRKQARHGMAKIIANAEDIDKATLLNWSNSIITIAAQFQPNPTVWPTAAPSVPSPIWSAFKGLMEAFYEQGLKSGLPYTDDGTPTATNGVNYATFVKNFRDAHRQNASLEAREVCVLCGGPLGKTPQVDHWIAKSAYPLLSVCMDNLLPICGECNSSDNKATKAVHSNGNFTDWFHPYLRSANDMMRLSYTLTSRSVTCSAITPIDQPKVENLNKLLNLSDRWTREFKAEYAKQQGTLLRREKIRISNNRPRHTKVEVQGFFLQQSEDLVSSEPHYEVHQLLCSAMQEQSRLEAWQEELNLL